MKKNKIVRVGGYIRISTDETRQRYSLPAQEKRIREYVKSRRDEGWRLMKMYSDQKSAKNLDRPRLKTLLDDVEKGLLDMVLVVKLDRLSRNLADQLYLTDLFETSKIGFQATDEDVDLTSPDGVTWAQIRGAMNESEGRKNSYRTKKTMREKASQGGWNGGTPPLGYESDKSTKGLVPNPDKAPIVEQVFQLYVEKRLGAHAIAKELNGRGLRTRAGGHFSTSTIIGVITNPIYSGNVRWDGETFPGKHRRLVGKDTFNQAQVILAERRGDPSLCGSNSTSYPFSGILQCEKCKRHLVGVSAHGRNKVYPYYACPGRFKWGECDLENLPKEKVDQAILSQLTPIFTDSKLLDSILQRVNAKRAKKLPRKKAEFKTVTKQIRQKRAVIKRYLSAFETGKLGVESTHERVGELENEIALLEEGKARLDTELRTVTIEPLSVQQIREVVSKLTEIVLSPRPSEGRAFLRNVVKTVKVFSASHLQPYYRIPMVRTVSGMAPRIPSSSILSDLPPLLLTQPC
ncbi:MAG: recombinase family protein [Candidatus Aerophobetes bacterium]